MAMSTIAFDVRPLPPATLFKPWIGGVMRIHEPVTTQGTAITNRRFRLFDQNSGQLVATGVSQDGELQQDGLVPNRPYIIVALDDTQTYQAVAISHRYATVTGARPGA